MSIFVKSWSAVIKGILSQIDVAMIIQSGSLMVYFWRILIANSFIPGVISITVHSEINCLIFRMSLGFKYDKAQCWYQEVYYSHSLRHFFCSSIGSSSRDMDPQYFFKSGLLTLTGRSFKAFRIFSRDVSFFIVVTIFLIFISQMY